MFFHSDRNGNVDVYRQFIDQQIAQPIVAGPQDEMGVTVSPDGGWYYYCILPEGWKSTVTRPLTWMKIPSAGGAPLAVFDAPVAGGIECALPPWHVCLFVEIKPGELVVHSFDPEKGRGSELGRINIGALPRHGLSADGSRVAVALGDRIRILTLGSGATADISPSGWKHFNWVRWAPDGKGLYVTSLSSDRTTILYLDLQGHAWPLFEAQDQFDLAVIPSPDGRHLAFTYTTAARNAWMIEGF